MATITVTQLLSQIKTLIEREQTLRNVWLQGEVSNFVRATSGHCYFTLKDERAVLACVMWKQDALRLGRLPQNGQQVLVHGYVSLYESQGKMQFYADALELAGVGRLYQEFEALKARLAAEGLVRSRAQAALAGLAAAYRRRHLAARRRAARHSAHAGAALSGRGGAAGAQRGAGRRGSRPDRGGHRAAQRLEQRASSRSM